MYNKYELLWLWYHYHCEKADQFICSGTSRYDENCNVPMNSYQQALCTQNAFNNRKIIEMVAEKTNILYEHADVFNRFKNVWIFKEYEELDRRGCFDFIHNFVEELLERQRQEKRKKELNQQSKEFLFL